MSTANFAILDYCSLITLNLTLALTISTATSAKSPMHSLSFFERLNFGLWSDDGKPVIAAQYPRCVRACSAVGASAIHVRCMDKLTEDAVQEIEQIHSSWIEFELAGEDQSLLALCADDIELWPPDAQPVLGRVAVSAQLAQGSARIHSIEISDRRIRGSNEIAYLTASYTTTFSSAEDSIPRQAIGSHLWILQKHGGAWLVTLVSWSLWGRTAISATP
jgi:ketosteroid isomerase-like protein